MNELVGILKKHNLVLMTFVNLYIGVKFQMSILRYTTGIFLIMSKGGICLENFK